MGIAELWPAVLAGGIVFAVVGLVVTVKALLIIVPPNRVAVITGRARRIVGPEGQKIDVGFRSIIGGRTLRIPIIESVDYLSLEAIPVEVTVKNAFSRGNIPLNVEAVANIKIAARPEGVLNNASQRFLGKNMLFIKETAQETLMGNLRGVLATLTPEEVNEDRLAFAQKITAEVGEDFETLGLQLDVLKIQNVSDEVGYLDAIGRERTAIAIRQAEVAEAENHKQAQIAQAMAVAETKEQQADAYRRAEVAQAEANLRIAEAQNALRVRQAELDKEAMSKEKVAVAEADRAEAVAQKALQEARVGMEEQRYKANVVVAAAAEREAALLRAEADAAPIRERGLAQAEALQALIQRLQEGGDSALQVLLLEKLPEMLERAIGIAEGIDIDRLIVLDGGEGEGMASVMNQRLKGAMALVEGVAAAVGADPAALLGALGDRKHGASPVEPEAS